MLIDCDTYQPTQIKECKWVFLHMCDGHLTYLIHTVLPHLRIMQRVKTIEEIHSLVMHGGISNALFCLILTL